ncbi:MAG TPA: hypothetical protein VJ739_10795 [Gemmataceae bacterium]|nr:hypothetical protein [Gemmataceae bacterium]
MDTGPDNPIAAVKKNGVLIAFGSKNTLAVSADPLLLPRGPGGAAPLALKVEVEWRGWPLKEDWFSPLHGPYRDGFGSDHDVRECFVRVWGGGRLLASLGRRPYGRLHQAFMVWPGPQEYETDNGVTVPPALRIVDERGALWTLGFETAPRELSPEGEFAFDVLRDGVPVPGAVASRVEYRCGQVRIFTRSGWRRWLGREFS